LVRFLGDVVSIFPMVLDISTYWILLAEFTILSSNCNLLSGLILSSKGLFINKPFFVAGITGFLFGTLRLVAISYLYYKKTF